MEENCQLLLLDRFMPRERAPKPFNSGLYGPQGPPGYFWGGGGEKKILVPAGNRTTNPRTSSS